MTGVQTCALPIWYLHNSGTLSRCGRAPDPAPSLGRHDTTPGGLRHQLPNRHSNPSENANEFFSLRKWTTPPPRGRTSGSWGTKPRASNPLPERSRHTNTYTRTWDQACYQCIHYAGVCACRSCSTAMHCGSETLAPKQDRDWAFVFKGWPALTCQSVAPLGMML